MNVMESFDHLPVLEKGIQYTSYKYDEDTIALVTYGYFLPYKYQFYCNAGTYEGQYHRIDGPSVVEDNGRLQWFIFGKPFATEEDYWRTIVNEY